MCSVMIQPRAVKAMNEPRARNDHMEEKMFVSLQSEKVTASLAADPPHEFPFRRTRLLQLINPSEVPFAVEKQLH